MTATEARSLPHWTQLATAPPAASAAPKAAAVAGAASKSKAQPKATPAVPASAVEIPVDMETNTQQKRQRNLEEWAFADTGEKADLTPDDELPLL